ncbi:ABC transporter substrate-binding protein [Maricaulis maris]|nr:ABC transporter substrate-binding protein [Maricaulis maris]
MSSAITRRGAAFMSACVSATASLLLAPQGLAQEATPHVGVASASLCADAYVLAVVPMESISALSWQVDQPVSVAPSWSRGLPKAWPDAARLLALAPALTVFGTGEAGRTGRLLERSGQTVFELAWADDFDAVRGNLRALGAATGQAEAADAVIADIDARLAEMVRRAEARARTPRIAYLSVSGGSAGAGTYIDTAIVAAGGINVVAENGAVGWTRSDPEFALTLEADIVLTSFFIDGYASTFNRARRHAAYRRLLDHPERAEIPAGLWPCAGPRLVDAAELIADAIDAWEDGA